ncbi:CvfB family protein [Marinimicrobium alkaliphilum]|uniref:CvfB family protein n=1 Tax=Marinimicrobium alkaliphilum TaxID=2202654 RepID=UPI000DB9E423|nr:S1-like domain-containing RNA-binding protein [Marinimicrobium alkaliphilum]
MIHIGRTNNLKVIKQVDFGVFLDGGDYGNILLPRRYVPEGTAIGDQLDVFIYFDSDDDIIATTLKPKAQVGECALLKVKEVNKVGAFLDWGLPKDLLVPYNEQHKPMEEGRSYVVTVFVDNTERISASSKLSLHLDENGTGFTQNQKVDLLIWGRTEMGYKAVINHTHLGLIFRDFAFKALRYGDQTTGYIKAIRQDGKIDLSLQLPAGNRKAQDTLEEKILAYLEANSGVSKLTDKSKPEDIYREFNVSKGNYKSALGRLYKQRKITIEKDRITLS